MKIERSTFTVTSILDRSGRRIANHIVDKSEDSLHRDPRRNPHDPDESLLPETPNDGVDEKKGAGAGSAKKDGSSGLNITA